MPGRMISTAMLALIANSFLAWSASAQAPPRGAEQGQISRQFESLPEPRAVPEGLELGVPMIRPPEDAREFRFRLSGLRLVGTTVYDSEQMLVPYLDRIGQEVSLYDLYQIAEALTARYRNDGYILSQVFVPAQTIANGQVELQAIEGFISEVSFRGKSAGRTRMLRKMAQRIQASRPLRAAVLERFLLLMNDLPGATAQGTIRASASVAGASELVVTFYHDWVDSSAAVNNHNSEFLGPEQVGVGLTFNSLFRAYESTALNYVQATDADELEYASVVHSQTWSANGLRVTVSASTSESVPGLGAEFETFNLETSSDDVSLRVDYPIRRSRSSNLYLFSRLTYHDGETKSFFFAEQSADTISALRLGLTYDFVDRWRGVSIVELEVSKGLDIFDSSQFGDPNLSRPGGDPEFAKATLYAARLQSLGAGWSLLFALRGQYAFDNVLSPEEFAYGGELFGRAYDPSELVGDHGAAGKLELRYTRQGRRGSGATLYAFYDIGMVDQELGPGEFPDDAPGSAASAGLGLRFDIGRHISGYIEGAAPLTRPVLAEGNDDPRFFAGLRIGF